MQQMINAANISVSSHTADMWGEEGFWHGVGFIIPVTILKKQNKSRNLHLLFLPRVKFLYLVFITLPSPMISVALLSSPLKSTGFNGINTKMM